MPDTIHNKSGNSASSLAQYVEPATILTISVAAIYLIGWSYMGGYFHRIGIQPTSLDLSVIYYLERGAGTIITVWLVVGCFFIGAASKKLGWLVRALPLLLIFAWSSFVLLTSSSYRPHIVLIAIVEAAVVGFPMLLIRPEKILRLVPDTPKGRVILAVFLYSILIFGARFVGGYIGKKAVEGKSYGSFENRFCMERESTAGSTRQGATSHTA